MDLPLSCLSSLTMSILGTVISGLALEARGTKVTLCKALEEVSQEERVIIPETSFISAAFWKFSISSSLTLEVLSNCALT